MPAVVVLVPAPGSREVLGGGVLLRVVTAGAAVPPHDGHRAGVLGVAVVETGHAPHAAGGGGGEGVAAPGCRGGQPAGGVVVPVGERGTGVGDAPAGVPRGGVVPGAGDRPGGRDPGSRDAARVVVG